MDDISPADRRPDPYKKQRERARAESAELDRTDTMLLTRPASDWHLSLRDRKAYSEELFGPLWRVGEVALLFGPRGVGKSILAVQIAESIARGRPVLPIPKSKSRRRGEKVLYVDMQRSEAQWAERYTLPSPVPGKPPRRYRFSRDLLRAGIDWTNVDLDAYKRDPVKYALHSIFNKIEESRAKVVIIDDILLGGANALGRKGIPRTMLTLKMWAATEGLSILVLAQSNEKFRIQRSASKHCPLSTVHCSLSAMADTVFALAPSTFGPQYRYIKHLTSKSPPPYEGGVRLQPGGGSLIAHPDEVLTFQLNSPPRLGGVAAGRGGSSDASANFPLSTVHCPLVGFAYLGPSAEHDHLRDYAQEARDDTRRVSSPHVSKGLTSHSDRKKQLRKAARESAVEMLMSKEYWRYLDE